MLLTRATDNRLKTFFTGGEVRFGDAPFQGKGFRSLGQEAIYAAAIRLRRGEQYRARRGLARATSSRRSSATSARRWRCVRRPRRCAWCCRRRWARPVRRWTARICTSAISRCGILPASAPLATGTLTLAGMALAFARAGLRPRRGVVHRRGRRRRSASGTRRSTCARRGGCPRSSASRTTRRRCRRRCASSPRCACSPTRPRATAFPASRSTAPIPTRSRRRSRGRSSGRGPGPARR